MVCFVVSAVALIMAGPSLLLKVPDELFLILIGMAIFSLIQSLNFINSIPECIESYQVHYEISEGLDPIFDHKLNDCISSLYNLFYCLFSFLGPLVGGTLYQHFGYKSTMDTIMIAELVIAMVFVIFNCGIHVYRNHDQ